MDTVGKLLALDESQSSLVPRHLVRNGFEKVVWDDMEVDPSCFKHSIDL